MNRELVQTYYKHDRLVVRPYTMWRYSQGNGRIYYSFDFDPHKDGSPTLFISLTTLTKETLPTSIGLIKFYAELGFDKATAYAAERAIYGTMMHELFGRLMKFGSLSKDDVISDVQSKAPTHVDKNDWIEELWRDCMSFQQFIRDYDVVPLAIEIVLGSKDGYATAIDLVCEMNDEQEGFWGETYKTNSGNNKKGDPKKSKKIVRINGLINFKSGRKGFYDEHEIQLEFEKRLFEENFPDVKIDKIFNFAPVDWKTSKPTYKLKDQTDSLEVKMFKPLLAIAKLKLLKRTPMVKTSEGTMLFKETDPEKLNRMVPLKKYLKQIHKEDDLPIEEFQREIL